MEMISKLYISTVLELIVLGNIPSMTILNFERMIFIFPVDVCWFQLSIVCFPGLLIISIIPGEKKASADKGIGLHMDGGDMGTWNLYALSLE